MSFFKRAGLFFLIALLVALADFIYLGRPTTGIDDANIFFSYAHHFNQGEGFVFYTGGERVEGFTSFLWVLICSAFFAISSHPEPLLFVFLLLLTSLAITMVYEEVRKDVTALHPAFGRKYFPWIFGAFLVAIAPTFIAWSTLTLMENGLWNFLFTTIVVLLLQLHRNNYLPRWKKIALIITGMLLVLTRPEALAWTLIFTVILGFIQWKQRKNFWLPALFLILLASTAASLTYFRLSYFGYPLPNTYYAKISDSRIYNFKSGLAYLAEFVTTYHPVLTLSIALLVVTCMNKAVLQQVKRTSSTAGNAGILERIAIVSIIVAAGMTLPLTTGGDHFGGFRFYQGVLLLFAWSIPACLWLYQQIAQPQRNSRFVAVLVLTGILLAGGTLFNLKASPNTQLNYEFYLAADGRRTADHINTLFPTPPSVGLVAVGGFALHYKGATIDLMGLNNVLMGHSKGNRQGIKNHAAFNKDVFYQLQPDVLLPRIIADEKAGIHQYNDYLNTNNFESRAMRNIFSDTAFREAYHPVMIFTKDSSNGLFLFAGNRFLSGIEKDSTFRVEKITP